MLFPDIREDAAAVEFLLRIAQSPQAIRGAVNGYGGIKSETEDKKNEARKKSHQSSETNNSVLQA